MRPIMMDGVAWFVCPAIGNESAADAIGTVPLSVCGGPGQDHARVLRCWCGCLSGARCRQLYDLHINYMIYTLFFIPDYQFQKILLCFLG